MSRPRGSKNKRIKPQSAVIGFRADAESIAELRAVAKRDGKSLSQWLRDAALSAYMRGVVPPL